MPARDNSGRFSGLLPRLAVFTAAATVVLEHGFSADFAGSITSPSIVTNVASDFTAHFRLADLPPDTLVYYRVRMNGALVTPVKRFRTPPPVGEMRTVRIAVFNDWARSDFPSLNVALGRDPDLTFIATSYNISISGMLLETKYEVRTGDNLRCTFSIAHVEITADCEVKRVDRTGSGRFRYGVKFLNLDTKSIIIIEHYVKSKMKR